MSEQPWRVSLHRELFSFRRGNFSPSRSGILNEEEALRLWIRRKKFFIRRRRIKNEENSEKEKLGSFFSLLLFKRRQGWGEGDVEILQVSCRANWMRLWEMLSARKRSCSKLGKTQPAEEASGNVSVLGLPSPELVALASLNLFFCFCYNMFMSKLHTLCIYIKKGKRRLLHGAKGK